MKKGEKFSKKGLSHGNTKKNTPVHAPDHVMRREALKRIAYLGIGTLTGAVLMNSCEPYSDYNDYSDYSNYYSNYYSRYSNYYYDYYSVYSAYWDA